MGKQLRSSYATSEAVKIKLQATSANDLISLRLQPAADSARADIVMYQEYLATNREPKEVTVLQNRP
jgi:hypothetical protein